MEENISAPETQKSKLDSSRLFQQIFLCCSITGTLLLGFALGITLHFSISTFQTQLDDMLKTTALSLADSAMVREAYHQGYCTDEMIHYFDTLVDTADNMDVLTLSDCNLIRLYHVNHALIGEEFVGGDFGAQFAEKLIEPMGFKVLSIWESGYRHMTNNTRPLEKPEDLKGIKFRTNENSMKVAMYDALDASIVIMAFSDVYTGLQNGTIDGQENPLSNIYSSSLQDVQKYLSLTGHMYDAAPFVCNMDWFNSLPTEYQEILMEEAKNAREVDLEENDENKYLDLLKEAGMEINEVDKTAFQAKMDGVWADYASQYADGQSWIDLATSFNK